MTTGISEIHIFMYIAGAEVIYVTYTYRTYMEIWYSCRCSYSSAQDPSVPFCDPLLPNAVCMQSFINNEFRERSCPRKQPHEPDS